MGLPEVWIFDPANRNVTLLPANGPMQTVTTGILTFPGAPIAAPSA